MHKFCNKYRYEFVSHVYLSDDIIAESIRDILQGLLFAKWDKLENQWWQNHTIVSVVCIVALRGGSSGNCIIALEEIFVLLVHHIDNFSSSYWSSKCSCINFVNFSTALSTFLIFGAK